MMGVLFIAVSFVAIILWLEIKETHSFLTEFCSSCRIKNIAEKKILMTHLIVNHIVPRGISRLQDISLRSYQRSIPSTINPINLQSYQSSMISTFGDTHLRSYPPSIISTLRCSSFNS
jgi:hypothetical protein